MAGKRNIDKRRRLAALFETGQEVRFNVSGVNSGEPDPEDIVIFVRPPDPLQREMSLREAQASRARALLEARKSTTSDTYVNAAAYISGLSSEALIDYVLEQNEQDRHSQARRDVLARKEWDDFNTLRDAMRKWEEAGYPDTEEWQPLKEKDLRFGEQVEEKVRELREGAEAGLRLLPREEIERRAMERRVEQSGSAVFMREYEQWMLHYACRDGDDHTELFFESPEDLKSMPQFVQDHLATVLADFISEASEAKNSQGAAPSLDLSVPSEKPETSESSTQEEQSE